MTTGEQERKLEKRCNPEIKSERERQARQRAAAVKTHLNMIFLVTNEKRQLFRRILCRVVSQTPTTAS